MSSSQPTIAFSRDAPRALSSVETWWEAGSQDKHQATLSSFERGAGVFQLSEKKKLTIELASHTLQILLVYVSQVRSHVLLKRSTVSFSSNILDSLNKKPAQVSV